MTTVMKPRRPQVAEPAVNSASVEDNMTVEKYLEAKFEEMIKDFRNHSETLVMKLRREYADGAAAIGAMMPTPDTGKALCVTLKCVAGPHIGQRFRLEPSTDDGEDVFKMGRSTGKLFKEKGVSLYKDKEISTTHAKVEKRPFILYFVGFHAQYFTITLFFMCQVEIRNGQAFVIDMKSTNGSQLNGEDLQDQTPYRLKDGDVITMGSTELLVHITDINDEALDKEN
eukprot:gene29601-35734_t